MTNKNNVVVGNEKAKARKSIRMIVKLRKVVFTLMLATIVGLSVVICTQSQTINHLKQVNASVVKAKNNNKIPADGKVHRIKTNLFEIEVVNYDGANFDATITPKRGRLLGEQGTGAKGLELFSVSTDDKGTTTIQ